MTKNYQNECMEEKNFLTEQQNIFYNSFLNFSQTTKNIAFMKKKN